MKTLEKWILTTACAWALTMPGRADALTYDATYDGAPTADRADGIISRIDKRIACLDSLIFHTAAPAAVSSGAPEALEGRIEVAPDYAYASALDAVVKAQTSEIKAQTGVQLTGQTYYRPDAALGIDDDDEDVSRYTGKIQVEARWYFLQSGLLKRSSRIRELQLKADIDRIDHERGRTDPGIYARREQLRINSDSVLASVMLHRVDNLALLEEAYIYLLGNQNISGDELLKILDDRADAERRLATIATMPVRADRLACVTAATVEIDTVAAIAALATTDLDLQLLDLKGQLLDCQAENTTWWSDVRIAPFARYSHYFRHNMAASNNVDVGVSFTIPVNAEARKHRKSLQAQKALLDCERDGRLDRAADRVRYIAMEADRLNRAIVGECERATTLRNYLQMRRNAYDNREGEYNRMLALKEYNSYLRCLENIIDLQYRRDYLLADLQALLPSVEVLTLCRFTLLTP